MSPGDGPVAEIADAAEVKRDVQGAMAQVRVDVAFVDGLVKEFDLPDREALLDAMGQAAMACDGAPRIQEELGAFCERRAVLGEAIRTVLEGCPRERKWLDATLARELPTEFGPTRAEAAARLDVALRTLALAAPVVALPAGVKLPAEEKEGRPREAAVRTIVDILASYWATIGRKWRQDHQWRPGTGDKLEPHAPADRFAYAIVKRLLPGEEDKIRTISREMTRRYAPWPEDLRKEATDLR